MKGNCPKEEQDCVDGLIALERGLKVLVLAILGASFGQITNPEHGEA